MKRFLDRFWRGFWKGFGKFLECVLEIILISLSYYFAYHVGKDLGKALEGIWTDFEIIFDSFLNDVGGHVGMILLLLLMLFQYSFHIMRSLCQEECEADVSTFFCEADVKANAKPMSRRMRSRCQGDREADVEKAPTRAHAEWTYTRTQTN